jgi:(p)ppGpp synthase/HD superfamily hydrolase
MNLDNALHIAVAAHKGQKDKADNPYILHPLRLMMRMQTETEMIVAVLHDVVEDSDWTLDMLRDEGFSQEILAAVDCVTRREGESYQAFNERLAPNPLARKVKIADLEDNMDIRRLPTVTTEEQARMNRYLETWRYLREFA